MIILFSKKSNTFSEKFNRNLTNLPYINCPYCNSNNFIKWGYYDRSVYYIDNDEIIFDTLKIQRIKCKDCNHTHCLLPCPIIPYKQYTLDVILSSISNDQISYNYEISYDTIIKWKYQFNMFLPFLKTMFNNISKFDIIDKLKNNIYLLYYDYIKVNKKILMMMRPGIFSTCYF